MILAIDLGQKTTGLATSDSAIATSYLTIKHKSIDDAVNQIAKISDNLGVEKLIVGFVEGKIKSYFESFIDKFKAARPQVETVMWDETLTSGQAREALIKQQVAKTKRGQKEHEMAAAIILQSYLDEND